jgi:hypothetical protein
MQYANRCYSACLSCALALTIAVSLGPLAEAEEEPCDPPLIDVRPPERQGKPWGHCLLDCNDSCWCENRDMWDDRPLTLEECKSYLPFYDEVMPHARKLRKVHPDYPLTQCGVYTRPEVAISARRGLGLHCWFKCQDKCEGRDGGEEAATESGTSGGDLEQDMIQATLDRIDQECEGGATMVPSDLVDAYGHCFAGCEASRRWGNDTSAFLGEFYEARREAERVLRIRDHDSHSQDLNNQAIGRSLAEENGSCADLCDDVAVRRRLDLSAPRVECYDCSKGDWDECPRTPLPH